MSSDKPEVMVPEEATDRGPILRGELKSPEISVSDVLAQFEKLTPNSKRAKVYFYPTLEQAKTLFHSRSPFAFEGSWSPREGTREHWRSPEIWLKPSTSISFEEMRCLTFCSGKAVDLHINTTYDDALNRDDRQRGFPTARFVANRCFLLQILATNEEEPGSALEAEMERPTYNFELRDNAQAEIKRQVFSRSFGIEKEVTKSGYSIFVHGFKNAEIVVRDIECLLILASFASRERSVFWHWSIDDEPALNNRYWRFGMKKWPKRRDGQEPLLPRDSAECNKFLSSALKACLSSTSNQFLDAAVYALLDRDLPLETKIVRLLSGIQSALLFAVPKQNATKRALIRDLYEDYKKAYDLDLSDLWPLFDQKTGVSLTEIRNFVVHGGVFTERDWMALSYAVENLHWILERILLVALGWDIALSSVSPRKLRLYCAYDWRTQQQSLRL